MHADYVPKPFYDPGNPCVIEALPPMLVWSRVDSRIGGLSHRTATSDRDRSTGERSAAVVGSHTSFTSP